MLWVPSSNPQATLDGAKKKKKSRKSKNKEGLPSVIHTNGAVSSPPRVEEQPRPSKRKRDLEPDGKKKKKRQAAEDIVNEADAPTVTTPKKKDRPVDPLPDHPDKEDSEPASNGVEKTTPTIPSSEPAPEAAPSSEPNNNLTRSGRPRKIRGSRIGGKNNLKVGFFVKEETQKLEKYKVDFCNRNGFNHNPKMFDAMVQHSERDSGEWPCPTDICRKSEFWAEIYAILPDRDRRSVYRFMRRHFQDSTQKPHEWTAEQDEELVRLRAEHGPKYALIAKLLGRSDDDVTQRWKNRLEYRGTQNRGAWTEAEMRSLMSTIQDIWNIEHTIHPELAGKDIYGMSEQIILWGNVSTAMNHVRSRQQCADRWRKILRHVEILRKTVDPDAVFDPAAATKRKKPRNDVKKSNDHVEGDDSEEEAEESIAPDSTPGMTPKLGLTDHQQLLSLGSSSSKEISAKPHIDPQPESEDEINEASFVTAADEPAPPSAASHPTRQHNSNSPSQSKDEINKASKSSKKRKRSETERPVDEPEPKVGAETPTTTITDADKKARKAAKKEKKRLKREKREREERERQEAEAAAAARQAKEDRKKEKKEKKERKEREQEKEKKKKSKKSMDTVETNGIDTSAAAAPLKKMKTKHRESIPGLNGTDIEGNKSVKSPKKSKKSKRKSREASSKYDSPAARAQRSNAESDDGGGNESSDYDIKIEGDDSD
ncbi:uncharacterized protein N7459_008627 [Penicillium hispanicum]|uniref:uncharacterized protein n=1 Tax=Penicillium hispanicum TaxID=1080232 RepID=UPI002541513B|nr:uncharacterized protein N7459_008627 [Penicillium hispanicum]KAJ5574200.1 hypothetical protein N7459_008627 [Penicillium hispanicum]